MKETNFGTGLTVDFNLIRLCRYFYFFHPIHCFIMEIQVSGYTPISGYSDVKVSGYFDVKVSGYTDIKVSGYFHRY